MNDYIERQAMLDAVDKLKIIPSLDGTGKPTPTEDFRVQFLGTVLKVPSADVVSVAEIYDAGYKGKEVQFRIGGRLFAIRELAQ